MKTKNAALALCALTALPLSAMAGLKGTPEGCDNYASNIQFLAGYRDRGWPLKLTVELVNTYDYSKWGDGKMTAGEIKDMKTAFLREVAQLYGADKHVKADDIYTNRYVGCMGNL